MRSFRQLMVVACLSMVAEIAHSQSIVQVIPLPNTTYWNQAWGAFADSTHLYMSSGTTTAVFNRGHVYKLDFNGNVVDSVVTGLNSSQGLAWDGSHFWYIRGREPLSFAAAIKAMVALEAQCSPSEISLTVLGVPARGFVVPWSEASIGGYALERVLTQVQLSRIEARMAPLWPPGPHTLGLAAARVAEAVASSSRRQSVEVYGSPANSGFRKYLNGLTTLTNGPAETSFSTM